MTGIPVWSQARTADKQAAAIGREHGRRFYFHSRIAHFSVDQHTCTQWQKKIKNAVANRGLEADKQTSVHCVGFLGTVDAFTSSFDFTSNHSGGLEEGSIPSAY